jgi:uncharacterized protein
MAVARTATGLVDWHELVTPDLTRAVGFYAELLGWDFAQWKPAETDYPLISIAGRTHGGFLERRSDVHAHWRLYVTVDDVDRVAALALEAGGSVETPPEAIPDVGRFAVVGDGQGATIAALEPESAPDHPSGVFVWDEVLTADVAAATRFYGDVFGWEATEAMPGRYWTLGIGDVRVAGLMQAPAGVAPAWYPYAATEDVDRTVSYALDLGALIAAPPMEAAGTRFAVLVDPWGAAFGVMQQR